MYELGDQSVFFPIGDAQIGRGESMQDTARVLSRYMDGIMIRSYEQSVVEALAKYDYISIMNGITDLCHPCQLHAAVKTVCEHRGAP
jgi:Ornithine carbamoyltransferase